MWIVPPGVLQCHHPEIRTMTCSQGAEGLRLWSPGVYIPWVLPGVRGPGVQRRGHHWYMFDVGEVISLHWASVSYKWKIWMMLTVCVLVIRGRAGVSKLGPLNYFWYFVTWYFDSCLALPKDWTRDKRWLILWLIHNTKPRLSTSEQKSRGWAAKSTEIPQAVRATNSSRALLSHRAAVWARRGHGCRGSSQPWGTSQHCFDITAVSVVDWGEFAPVSGDIFVFHKWGGAVLPASSEHTPKMLLNIPECTELFNPKYQ